MTFVFYLMKVIRYYSPDLYPRTYHPPNPQKWNDNNVAAKDQFERMSGYTYFGILDHDEFLIPSRNRSLKQMMVSCLTHLNRMEFPTLIPFRWFIPYNCGPVFWNQPQSDTWPSKKPSPYIYILNFTESWPLHYTVLWIKETRSVTMNIFRKKNIFSFQIICKNRI